MKDDRLLLEHAVECLRRIDEYVVGGKDAFLASSLVQDAVLRNLQVLSSR